MILFDILSSTFCAIGGYCQTNDICGSTTLPQAQSMKLVNLKAAEAESNMRQGKQGR
jgi:hypothetical protein